MHHIFARLILLYLIPGLAGDPALVGAAGAHFSPFESQTLMLAGKFYRAYPLRRSAAAGVSEGIARAARARNSVSAAETPPWLRDYEARWRETTAALKTAGRIIRPAALVTHFMGPARELAANLAAPREPKLIPYWRRLVWNYVAYGRLWHALVFPAEASDVWVYEIHWQHRSRELTALLGLRVYDAAAGAYEAFGIRLHLFLNPLQPQLRADFEHLDPLTNLVGPRYQMRTGVDREDDVYRPERPAKHEHFGIQIHTDVVRRYPTPAFRFKLDQPVWAWRPRGKQYDKKMKVALTAAQQGFARCLALFAEGLDRLPHAPPGARLNLRRLAAGESA